VRAVDASLKVSLMRRIRWGWSKASRRVWRSRLGRSPALAFAGPERRLDRVRRIFGGDLCLGETLDVEPSLELGLAGFPDSSR
jgi:hypothetical protein